MREEESEKAEPLNLQDKTQQSNVFLDTINPLPPRR